MGSNVGGYRERTCPVHVGGVGRTELLRREGLSPLPNKILCSLQGRGTGGGGSHGVSRVLF